MNNEVHWLRAMVFLGPTQDELRGIVIEVGGHGYENFINWNGYLPPQKGIDADALIADGLIPETLAPAVVRPAEFLANQELLQLTVEGERLWDQAWSQFRAG